MMASVMQQQKQVHINHHHQQQQQKQVHINHHHQQQQHRHQPVFRTYSSSFDSYGYLEQNNVMLEKRQRQVFLRSYQFCRKKSLTERIKTSLFSVKRVMWLRLRSACRIRKLVWSRLRWGFHCRRRRFVRLINPNNNYHNSKSNCFW